MSLIDRKKITIILEAPFTCFICLISLLFASSCVSSRPVMLSHELLAGVSPIYGKQELTDEIEKVISSETFRTSKIGISIVKLSDKSVLFEKNEDLLFHPASTMKLFTTAAALKHLGPDFRFGTSLSVLPGPIKNGTVNGDLFLVGTGDPSLETSDLTDLAARLSSRGIVEISGRIICDETFFDALYYGKGWMWDDQPYKDFAPISALTVNRNTMEIFVSPGLNVGYPPEIRTLPLTNYIKINNNGHTIGYDYGITQEDGSLTVLRQWQVPENIMNISGPILVGSKERRYERNIVDPAIYTGTLLKEELRKAGINVLGDVVLGKAPPEAEVIVYNESDQLSELIVAMNKMSHNLYAELILKAIGRYVTKEQGTSERGIEVILKTVSDWGLGSGTVRFADGSGVSRYGLVSPRSLTKLLEEVYDDFSIKHEFVASLAVAGVDGNLKHRQQNLSSQGLVHAKTGSMSGVSVLAGYAQSYDGEALAFTTMMEHFIGSAKDFRNAQDQICDILSRFAGN